jgi:hypothetical protein
MLDPIQFQPLFNALGTALQASSDASGATKTANDAVGAGQQAVIDAQTQLAGDQAKLQAAQAAEATADAAAQAAFATLGAALGVTLGGTPAPTPPDPNAPAG